MESGSRYAELRYLPLGTRACDAEFTDSIEAQGAVREIADRLEQTKSAGVNRVFRLPAQ